jgi:hypothetical protein
MLLDYQARNDGVFLKKRIELNVSGLACEALKKNNWVNRPPLRKGGVHATVRHLADKYCELMQNSPAAIGPSGKEAERCSGLHSGFSTHIY